MAFTPRSAKNAKVRFASTTMYAKSWTVTPETDELDVTNHEGGGFYECIGGITKCQVQIEFDLDGGANNYDFSNIQPGSVNTSVVKLYLNDTTGPFWNFPKLFIKSMPNTSNVKETVKGTLSAVGSGTFSYPTGPF